MRINAMKLEINKSYSLYTLSDYITNKKIKILGFIGYERASQYASFVENVAINEKFIDTTDDSGTYLKQQIYYDCGELEYINGEWKLNGNHIIIWDDILDLDRTTRLYENYTYKLDFMFKDVGSTDVITKEDVIEVIKNALESHFNTTKQKIGYELKLISDNTIDSVETQLEKTQEALDKANDVINTFISLKDEAKKVTTDIVDNELVGKVNVIGSRVEDISSSIETIMQQLK